MVDSTMALFSPSLAGQAVKLVPSTSYLLGEGQVTMSKSVGQPKPMAIVTGKLTIGEPG
uniref:Uncharacterized protein n=1 Tax=Fagus sylvatica TaxID=28930 RepID=A0A2N9GFQ7_FAGSY